MFEKNAVESGIVFKNSTNAFSRIQKESLERRWRWIFLDELKRMNITNTGLPSTALKSMGFSRKQVDIKEFFIISFKGSWGWGMATPLPIPVDVKCSLSSKLE
jgi:hypothetical protein